MPVPPTYLIMPAGAESTMLVTVSLLLAVAVAIGICLLVRDRDPLFLYCLVGGALATFVEPVVDVLGLIYFPEKGTSAAFTLFGRGMPLFAVISYAATIGTFAYLAYRYLERGITPARLMVAWATIAIFNTLGETPAVHLNLYRYYGHQPLDPWGFPLWIAFVDPLPAILAGALLVKLRKPLEERGALWAAAVLVPMAFAMGIGTTAWPMWLALNSANLPVAAPSIAAGITLGLALFLVWIVGIVFAHPGRASAPAALPPREAELHSD